MMRREHIAAAEAHGAADLTARTRPIVVVGAGMVGPIVAMYLARRGAVLVLEHRPEPGRSASQTGRSLHLVLSARGWRVLRDLGIDERVRAICMPLRGRIVHDMEGDVHFEPYGSRSQEIWCVERTRLHRAILDAAAATAGVSFVFGARVTAVDPDAPAVVFEHEGVERRQDCDRLIGCDGAFSRVRAALELRGVAANVETLELGYKEIRLPAGPKGRWTFSPDCFHVWPRNRALFSVFPVATGEAAGSLFQPLQGEGPSFAAITSGAAARSFFASTFPDVAVAVPDLAEQYDRTPVSAIVTVSCDRWIWRDKVALVGDACHAMAPFMGQGMNCGFEDARVLDQCLTTEPDWGAALATYERARKPNADAIVAISLEHYLNLATPPGTHVLREARARVAARLRTMFPGRFPSLYERCAFTEESYAEARRASLDLDRLLDTFVEHNGLNLLDGSSEDVDARLARAGRRLSRAWDPGEGAR